MTAIPPAAEEVDLTVARALWAAGDPVVDVRSPTEYAAGHVEGAVNVPLDRLPFLLATLPPGQVLTVCSLGNRSRQGAERLARLGRPAVSLRGGTKAWAAAGLPTRTGTEPGERTRPRRSPVSRWWRRGRGSRGDGD
ncbi:rhodanese-like domain-containing protein [Actinopolymorpha sp. NPDC004070]|uniref:rhodanese-like domain-containing protein n=1 Tax=Actinopolymorpha sp. NPDC004070 TaxID=3154548 RepID=UPI00339FB278